MKMEILIPLLDIDLDSKIQIHKILLLVINLDLTILLVKGMFLSEKILDMTIPLVRVMFLLEEILDTQIPEANITHILAGEQVLETIE